MPDRWQWPCLHLLGSLVCLTGGVDREGLPGTRPVVPRPDPGGEHRADSGGREVRLPPRLKFSTYATWWIRQAVSARPRRQSPHDPVPVHMVETINKEVHVGASWSRSSAASRPPTRSRWSSSGPPAGPDILRIAQLPVSLEKPSARRRTPSWATSWRTTGPSRRSNGVREPAPRERRKALDALPAARARGIEMRYGLEGHQARTLEEVGRALALPRADSPDREQHAEEAGAACPRHSGCATLVARESRPRWSVRPVRVDYAHSIAF